MKGNITNIEKLTIENADFRRVLYTARHSQLVLMSIPPGGEIGEEVHDVDQFFRFEKGSGMATLNGRDERPISDGTALVVPAGMEHNIVNTSKTEALKLYTLYSPPHHRDGVVHHTKADAHADETDEFDGKTTEERNG